MSDEKVLQEMTETLDNNLSIVHRLYSENNKNYDKPMGKFIIENGYGDDFEKVKEFLEDHFKSDSFDKDDINEDYEDEVNAIIEDVIDDDETTDFDWINGDDRYTKIFVILKDCLDNKYIQQQDEDEDEQSEEEKEDVHNQIKNTDALGLDNTEWDISEQDKKETIALYKTQCPKICNKDMISDNNMITMLTIGNKQRLPYLQWIVDMYSRDRVIANNPISPQQWAATNPYCQKLKKVNGKKAVEVLESAIASFNHRGLPVIIYYLVILISVLLNYDIT